MCGGAVVHVPDFFFSFRFVIVTLCEYNGIILYPFFRLTYVQSVDPIYHSVDKTTISEVQLVRETLW